MSSEVGAYISEATLLPLVRFLRRIHKKAPIAARPSTPTGIPTPSPTLAPVLIPELESPCCVAPCCDPPSDVSLPPVVGRLEVDSVAVVTCEMLLKNVLVDSVEVDRTLIWMGAAVA